MVKKIAAITFIYLCTVAAWVFLGATVQLRTQAQDSAMKESVGQLWGTVQVQQAPVVTCQPIGKKEGRRILPFRASGTAVQIGLEESQEGQPGASQTQTPAPQIPSPTPAVEPEGKINALDGSDIKVLLRLEHRRKGLLWYSTYRVAFSGQYKIVNNEEEPGHYLFEFALPVSNAVYDNFKLTVNGEEVKNLGIASGVLRQSIILNPGESKEIGISYNTQGMDQWWYSFGSNVTQMKNFSLVMLTDFDKVDFPQKSISPTAKEKTQSGWKLEWKYSNLLSGVQIGMDMPKILNPGPWASKIIYFAPVSLFLFFFLMIVFTTLNNIDLHPVHYFFIACAFFSYHLLLAYIVDHVSIHAAFWICSFVSIFLMVSYMRIVAGSKFAFIDIGISQFVYLVVFSYSFFFEGYTGLVVTVMCIATLFIIMQLTARLNWNEVFRSNNRTDGNNQQPDYYPI
ncbi:MAG: cell envelope integrity protein CreD [Firmicutes bacterium]|nr:cell envelope integrity protein CreD [Bacillota bacterium]